MPKIKSIKCHRILNSRAEWTIETHVQLDDGAIGVQTIPSGASKGLHEAVYVPVEKAIEIVEHPINDLLRDHSAFDQAGIDNLMLDMDGSANKKHLGGNSILSVSLAVAKAAAMSKNVELFDYLSHLFGRSQKLEDTFPVKFPTPVFNVLNGGKHAHNNLAFQEFMVIPASNVPFDKALEMGTEIYITLKQNLEDAGLDVDVGDEGGFAPNGLTVEKALALVRTAAAKKFKPGANVFFGLDVAAGSFHVHDSYKIGEENLILTAKELQKYYFDLLQKFELIYLEDPFYENDTQGWQDSFATFNKRLMVVGDDLVVTNSKFLKKALDRDLINAVIVKPNQVGTLIETLDFVKMAQKANLAIVVSHRSGDTAEDTFIADLAVAVGADFIKSGAPARGERVVKYNRLLEIFENFSG